MNFSVIQRSKVKVKNFKVMMQGGDITCEGRGGSAIFCKKFKEGKEGVHMDQGELEPGDKGQKYFEF